MSVNGEFLQGSKLGKVLIFCCFFSFSCGGLADDVIRYVDSKIHPDAKTRYFIDLLALAMEKTKAEFGDYAFEPIAVEMAQERTSAMLEKNELINLTWRMTSANLESRLMPIYVPLLKGMMGYRIFIIRKGEQNKFPQNISLQQLKALTVGQGYNWPDSDILAENDFNLVRGYDIYLLKMLAKKRFDYFPRALHEPWYEIAGNNDFIVEKNVLLKYNSPIYFFVNRSNKRLAQRISKGMQAIVDSGEMDTLFYQHPVTAGIIEKSNLNKRKVFELSNPLTSSKTKALAEDKRLWLDVLNE